MFNLREYRNKPDRLSDFLPWAALIAPGVIMQKERVLQKTIAFRGPDLASSSRAELRAAAARLNNALKRLRGDWGLFVEAQRFKTSAYPSSVWPNPVSGLVDEERRGLYEEHGEHYDSSYYATFVWLMPGDRAKRTEAIFIEDPTRSGDTARHDYNRDLQQFQDEVAQMTDIMRDVFSAVHELDDDETLSYLHSTVSTKRHPVRAPETPMYLDALLTDQTYMPGVTPVLGESYVLTATIKDFPSESLPGMLDRLNHLDVEYRWTTRFLFLDKLDAQSELTKYRRRWFSMRKGLGALLMEAVTKQESVLTNPDADAQTGDVQGALLELGDDLVAYGYYTATITVWDKDLDDCRDTMNRVCRVINGAGFTTAVETNNSFQAWLSSIPGHAWANIRRPILNTLNLAHVFPLSAIWAGNEYDAHFAQKFGVASPLMVCSSAGATPFRLNLNVGDVGHTAIFGPTGTGKSVLLCTLALQWQRYPKAQVIIFDKDRSARAVTMAVGGCYYEPGNDERPVAFQPLAHIDKTDELNWASLWIESLMELQHLTLTPIQRSEIHRALVSLASARESERTLSGYQHLLQDQHMREALAPYLLSGPFGQIFDADHDTLSVADWTTVEMGPLMALGEAAIVPALAYLFQRLDERFGGRPTLLILDEAWLFLRHAFFAERLQNWLKTLRKQSVYIVFASQELEDAVASPICSTILQACPTKLFLANESALDDYVYKTYRAFGLTDAEIQTIHSMTPKRDYFYKSPYGKRVFSLELGPVALAFVGRGSDVDQQFLNRLEEQHAPAEWARQMLRDRRVDWAVELLDESARATAA